MKTTKAQLAILPFALIILLLIAGIEKCHGQDSTEIKLNSYKQMFINGTITSQEYETLRKQQLGIKTQEVRIVKPDTLTYDEQVAANKMFKKGESDAANHFKTGGVFGGTFVTTLFCSPLIGLIPAIACSSSAPKEERFLNDNPQLFKDDDYMRGYKKEAAREKRASAWGAWGAAFALQAAGGIVAGIVVGTSKSRK